MKNKIFTTIVISLATCTLMPLVTYSYNNNAKENNAKTCQAQASTISTFVMTHNKNTNKKILPPNDNISPLWCGKRSPYHCTISAVTPKEAVTEENGTRSQDKVCYYTCTLVKKCHSPTCYKPCNAPTCGKPSYAIPGTCKYRMSDKKFCFIEHGFKPDHSGQCFD